MSKKETSEAGQDLNFLEYPLWFQNERLPEGFIWSDRDGFVYRAGYKPPVRIDGLYLCYFMMVSQNNKWARHIVVSQCSAMKACGISPGKSGALRLHESLHRWINVTLSFEGTFYDGKDYQKLQFNVVNDWYLQKLSHHLEINLNKFWLEKIKNSNFSKFLDLNILRKLKRPLAMRLYEILLKNFMYRDEWSIDSNKLARKIPMARVYPSHIIERLRGATELINRCADITVEMTPEHYSRGRAMLHFKKISYTDTDCVNRIQNGDYLRREHLFELLPEEHRSKKTIRSLVKKAFEMHGFDYVTRNIRYTNQNCTKNYRAFLVAALKMTGGWNSRKTKKQKRKHSKPMPER